MAWVKQMIDEQLAQALRDATGLDWRATSTDHYRPTCVASFEGHQIELRRWNNNGDYALRCHAIRSMGTSARAIQKGPRGRGWRRRLAAAVSERLKSAQWRPGYAPHRPYRRA